ncbi:MAG: hypothetical protein EBY15_07715 [Gammaproteobacteria bacterium]|nr:hypothetical protein [Gammaproteobacteria bacterium]
MNNGVWTVINAETPEPTTGYTNIQYSITALEEGQGDTRTTTRTTVGVNATSALDIRYTMDISGNIKTVGMNSVSDYRIKSNVIDLPPGKTVDGLRPVKYLNTLTGREEYGFLAHEIQTVYPEMVVGNKDENIGYQTIQYDQLNLVIDALMTTYPTLSRSRMAGHQEIAPLRKTDPGPFFEWHRIDRGDG